MSVNTAVREASVAEVADLLGPWGFSFVRNARNSTEYRHAGTGKTFSIKRSRAAAVNQYQISELCNLLGVSREEFFAGPAPHTAVSWEEPRPESEVVTAASEAVAEPRITVIGPDPGPSLRSTPRRRVVQYLHSVGGSVRNDSGKATTLLRDALGMTVTGAPSLLAAMERDGQVIRRVGGKRTYEIVLIEDGPGVSWMLAQGGATPSPIVAPTPEPEPAIAEPEPVEPEPVVVAKLSREETDAIAEAVVSRLVHMLSRADREDHLRAERDEALAKLARTTEYAKRLRRERDDARDGR